MITPMTNIEQSVGRILREKHDFSPIVVDIIDTHDNFQRQWSKRKSFYKSQNYKIIQTYSSTYDPDASKWKVTYVPKGIEENKKIKEKINVIDEVGARIGTYKKTSSRSSTERSIADDSEEEEEYEGQDEPREDEPKKNKIGGGICFLKMKK
jgi:hypothetical protein